MGLFKKKPTVDPTDFLALRAELIDLKARLEAAEAEKEIIENRLASLDANAAAFSGDRNSMLAIVNKVDNLEQQVVESRSNEPNAELAATVQELQQRLGDVADPSSKISDLESQLSSLAERVEVVASTPPPEAPPAAPAESTGPDPETTERLDAIQQRLAELNLDGLDERLASVDSIGMQLSQLNARVSAQAEMGAQLSALRDRISQLQEQAGSTEELSNQVQELLQRDTSAAVNEQIAQLAERVATTDAEARQARELAATLESRINSVGTELANQISELGRDLDSLAQQQAEPTEAQEQAPAAAVSDELIEALRAGQVRLANEQARYEIAFRQDLAALAEHVRRASAR